MIEQFIALLQQHGLAITGEEVADILWLATQLSKPNASGEISNPAKQDKGQESTEQEKTQSQSREQETSDVRRRLPITLQSQHQKIDVYSAQTGADGEESEIRPARSVRLPAPPRSARRISYQSVVAPIDATHPISH